MKEPPTNWDARMGPAIGDANDTYFLKNEDWLEIKSTPLADCKRDGVIPWVRSGGRSALLEAEKLDIQIILGPNCVFANSSNPELNLKELTSPNVLKLLMHDDTNIALAKSLMTNPEKIRQVSYFMRPYLYEEPFKYEHRWDIYFHVKTGINKFIRDPYLNHTATHHGWYTFDELKYKAQHSKICIHGCHYDNYGLAIHEISLLGCPIVYDNRGLKGGTVCEGMGVEVSNIETCELDELKQAVEKAMNMDRKKVWEASKAFQNPERLKNIWRKAMLE